MSRSAETEPNLNTNWNRRWYDNFWIKLAGAAFASMGVGIVLINYASHQLESQRTSLEANLGSKIDPATEDIDTFMARADVFFDDYKQFRLDICESSLGSAMEGCEAVIAAAEESEEAQDGNTPTTIVTEPPTAQPN